MVRSRTIVKNCPKCESRVAVASKTCKCGYSFFNARRSIRIREADVDERRRTSRVRREKPNYYDSQEFEKKKKKKEKKVKRKVSIQEESPVEEKAPVNKETTASRAKRRRLRKEEEDGGGDLCAKLPPIKQELAAIILSEINRKMNSVVWTP